MTAAQNPKKPAEARRGATRLSPSPRPPRGLFELLAPAPGSVLALVGAGGKTAVVNLLARSAVKADARAKVLILPAAKIFPPAQAQLGAPLTALCTTLNACLAHSPQAGVQCLGVLDERGAKLRAPPPEHLENLARGYTLVLMEADGSAGLPCKGWREDEPPVPPFASHTLGVVSLAGLGRPADEGSVLRLSLFCALTGLRPGQAVTLNALAAMAGAPGGMFKNAAGQKTLLINAAEDAAARKAARLLARRVQKLYPDSVRRFIAGSARKDAWAAL